MTIRSFRWVGLLLGITILLASCAAPSATRSRSLSSPTGPQSRTPLAPAAPGAPAPPAPGGPDASAVAVGEFPGDVSAGQVRWGAAIQGNGDPARHEDLTTRPLGVRRTYYQWNQRTTALVNIARDDVANGRLPWVSIKTPGWAEMASGARDAEIDELLRGLDGLGGPVWLTVHHEPEGGGGSAGVDDPGGAPAWRAMQARVRARMDALGTRNIALAPILMAWTFDPRSGRDPLDWWVPGIWDFAGIDYYVGREAQQDIAAAGSQFLKARAFYGDRGLDLAVGEWGNRGTDAAAAEEMRDFYEHALGSATDGLGAQVIGLAYFDSNLNSSTGGWMLTGEPLQAFRDLVNQPTSVVAG